MNVPRISTPRLRYSAKIGFVKNAGDAQVSFSPKVDGLNF